MDSIENKEVRGVSLKTLYAVIVSTAITVLTVMGSYTSLKGEIGEVKTEKVADAKYNDLRMRTLEMGLSNLEIQYKELNRKIDETIRKTHLDGN